MSNIREYVGCKSIEAVNYDGKGNDLCNMWVTDEEIVRCRDCKWYVKDPDPVDPGWPMMCDLTGQQMVSASCYCSWGDRR